MSHVYLNESAIKDALKSHAITECEASELSRILEDCSKQPTGKKGEEGHQA